MRTLTIAEIEPKDSNILLTECFLTKVNPRKLAVGVIIIVSPRASR